MRPACTVSNMPRTDGQAWRIPPELHLAWLRTSFNREQRSIEAEYFGVQERYEEAAQALGVSVSLYPDDPETRSSLAQSYYALGQLDKAVAELRQVLRLDPHSVRAYAGLVWYLAQQNENEEALRVYHDALQHKLDSPPLHWAAGLAYLGENEIANAREQFSGLQNSSSSYRDLGELYLIRTDLYQGKLNAARVQLAAGIKRDQNSPEKGVQVFRRYLLGRSSLLLGNPAEARKQAGAILSTHSDDLQAEDVLAAGVLYARAGDTIRARNALRQLNSIRARTSTKLNNSNVMKLTGEIALAEARHAEATENFTAAVTEYPDGNAHLGLAKAFEAQRDWSRAAREWDQDYWKKPSAICAQPDAKRSCSKRQSTMRVP